MSMLFAVAVDGVVLDFDALVVDPFESRVFIEN